MDGQFDNHLVNYLLLKWEPHFSEPIDNRMPYFISLCQLTLYTMMSK